MWSELCSSKTLFLVVIILMVITQNKKIICWNLIFRIAVKVPKRKFCQIVFIISLITH